VYIKIVEVSAVNPWSKKRSVMRRYDLTAQMYDQRYGEEQEAKYKAALEGLNITHCSKVLDVGCGTGMFFNHVYKNADLVLGVDVSRQLLLQAKKSAQAHSNIYVVQADADHLPLKDDCFDAVFAFTVLQNIPKPLKTLVEMRRSAKYDAQFVVSGLKATIDLEVFGHLLQKAGLVVVSMRNEDALRCHVVICARDSK
jgi:ubiquinone/menaquinone biosynthesis C-methylase UbiE